MLWLKDSWGIVACGVKVLFGEYVGTGFDEVGGCCSIVDENGSPERFPEKQRQGMNREVDKGDGDLSLSESLF